MQEDDCCPYRSSSGASADWNFGAARWLWALEGGNTNEAFCRYHIPLKGTTAWHVSSFEAYTGSGVAADDATSYYCGPKASYGDIDAGNYPRMRADMLETPPIEIPNGGGHFEAVVKARCGAEIGARPAITSPPHLPRLPRTTDKLAPALESVTSRSSK